MGGDPNTTPGSSPQRWGLIAGLLAAVFFGLSAPLISLVSQEGSPLMIAALLYAGAAIALLMVRGFIGHQQEESPVQSRDAPPLLGLTVLGGMVGPICLVQGLSLLSAGSASLLLNLEAVFTLLIAVLIGREHLSRKGLIAAVLILSGAVLLTEGSLHGATLQGTVLIAGACLAWGIDNNLSQRLSLRDPLQIALLKAIGASAPMVLLALAAGQSLPDWPALLGLVAIGALGYGLSIWLDLLALRHLGAAREALVFSTTPFVGLLFSLLVLREAFTSAMAMASAAMPCCSRKTIPTGIAMTRSAMRIVTGTIQPAATPTTATTTPGMSSSQTPPRRPFGMPMSISTHLLSTSTPTSVMFITAIVIAMNLESLCYA